MRLTQEHLDGLVRNGCVVVPQFLTAQELSAARENMLRYVPSADELAATPERYGALTDDAENLQTEFPFAGDALNHISTHPEILSFVKRLLGTEEVLLSQSAIWAKYAGTGDFEQGLHLDYQGNSLVYPRDDGAFRQVNFIVYYSDVDEAMGPTWVVPRQHAGDGLLWPAFRTRKKHPALYRHERPILVKAGALLIFGMRTFHRASQITAPAGARFTHHLVYRSAGHAFSGYHQWSRFGEKPEMQHFLERTTPAQREALGFPKPGHAYWNAETLAGVAARYPGMDMEIYREAVRPSV